MARRVVTTQHDAAEVADDQVDVDAASLIHLLARRCRVLQPVWRLTMERRMMWTSCSHRGRFVSSTM